MFFVRLNAGQTKGNGMEQTTEITAIENNFTESFKESHPAGLKIVPLTIGGVTRNVWIGRYTEQHCWAADTTLAIKYRTGTKIHASFRPQVVERNGEWVFVFENRRGKRGVRPIGFADLVNPNSKW